MHGGDNFKAADAKQAKNISTSRNARLKPRPQYGSTKYVDCVSVFRIETLGMVQIAPKHIGVVIL
jgi:hypothetical protein